METEPAASPARALALADSIRKRPAPGFCPGPRAAEARDA